MKAQYGFTAGMVGVALLLAPAMSWSLGDSGSAPAAAAPTADSAPGHARHHPRRIPHHGAVRVAHPAPPENTTPEQRKLALQAPPLDHVIERQKLRYILAANDADAVDDSMSVSVSSTVAPVLVPVGQLYALPWAFVHPTQAWRIFTPIESPN